MNAIHRTFRVAAVLALFLVACGGAPTGVVEFCTLEKARRIGQVCESDPYMKPDGTTGYRFTVFHCEPLKRWATCPSPSLRQRPSVP